MKTAFYGDDFRRLANEPATLESALIDVCDIAAELSRYAGKLDTFAYSMERLDQWQAEGFRVSSSILAHNVVVGGLSDNEIAQVHAALAFVCSGDEYAAKEIAGRFLSAVRRVKVLRAIGRHPRGAKFYTLTEAIEKGRFTKAQWALAVKLAAEADETTRAAA